MAFELPESFKHNRFHFRWFVTAAGAVAMLLIVAVLVFNLITAPHPLDQLTTRVEPATDQIDRK